MNARAGRLVRVVAALLLPLASCGGDGTGGSEVDPAAGLRVVSLSPAITRTLIDLGAGDLLVGRTPYCRGLDGDVPAVGSLLEFDPEAMLAVDPDLLLVQPGAGGVAPGLAALAEREGWDLHAWRIDGLDDLRRLLAELPEVLADAPEADRIERRARERADDLALVLAPLAPAAAGSMGSGLDWDCQESIGFPGRGLRVSHKACRLSLSIPPDDLRCIAEGRED